MGKVGTAIKMLFMLRNNGRMKIKDIADRLEVSERQVQEYKDELQQAGIFIESKSGKYGGYQLMNDYNVNIPLNTMEIAVLENVSDFIESTNNVYSNEYKDILDKIKRSSKVKENDDRVVDYFYINPRRSINREEENKRHRIISDAYITNRKLNIKYKSINSKPGERIVHPYGIYTYNGDTYMIAFCEKRNEMRDFKICRIIDIDILDEKYKRDENFNFGEYTKNSIGNFKGKEIDIHLIIEDPFATIVSEKIMSENQVITEIDENTIDFRASVKGYEQIKSWIFGMGKYVKVIEPKKLADEILEDAKNMVSKYE